MGVCVPLQPKLAKEGPQRGSWREQQRQGLKPGFSPQLTPRADAVLAVIWSGTKRLSRQPYLLRSRLSWARGEGATLRDVSAFGQTELLYPELL